jgi:hypothetical protein
VEKFLDDFSRSAAAGNGWAPTTGGSTARIDQATGLPPPSLLADVPPLAPGTSLADNTISSAQVDIGSAQTLCLELDVLLDALGPATSGADSVVELVAVEGPTPSNSDVYIEVIGGGVSLVVGGYDPKPLLGFTTGQWQHIALRIPYGSESDPPAADVGYDAPFLTTGPQTVDVPTAVGLRLGLKAMPTANSGSGPVRAHFDNLHVTLAP